MGNFTIYVRPKIQIFLKNLISKLFFCRLSKTSNSDDFEKRRSQAAIRAQAKKELEKEQQISQEAQKLKETYGEKQIIEVEAPTGIKYIYIRHNSLKEISILLYWFEVWWRF